MADNVNAGPVSRHATIAPPSGSLRRAAPTFLAILAIALLIRAAVIFHPGHMQDVGLFERWASEGVRFGITSIYDRQLQLITPDYPPLLLYVYTAIGHVVYGIQGSFAHTTLFVAALKLPAIIADALVALLLLILGSRLGYTQRGLIAAGIYLIMPASWLDSAVWGQTDAFYSLLLLAAFAAIGFRRGVLAGVFVGLAVSAKFQVVAFLPLIAVLAASIDWRMFAKGLAACIVTVLAVFTPFIMAGKIDNVMREYSEALGSYQLLSVKAFNVWRLLFGDAARTTSNLGTFGGLTFRTWGIAAFLVALAAILVIASRAVRRAVDHGTRVEAVLSAAAMISLAFFLFPTEIHERYLFPFVVLAALWGTSGRREMAVFLVLSLAVGLNIAHSLPISVTDLFFRVVPAADRLVSLAVIVAGFAASAMMIRRLRQKIELLRPV